MKSQAEKRAVEKLKSAQPSFGAFRAAAAAEERQRAEEEIRSGKASEVSIGYQMPDGTIYAGISPDTQQPMFAAPANAPLSMMFRGAAKYAENLEAGDKKDFRLPTVDELDVLFGNREKGALAGTFNFSAGDTAGCYWSGTSTEPFYAHYKKFSDGSRGSEYEGISFCVRCIRSEMKP